MKLYINVQLRSVNRLITPLILIYCGGTFVQKLPNIIK